MTEKEKLIEDLRYAEEKYRVMYRSLNPYESFFVCEGQRGLVAIREAIAFIIDSEEKS